MSIESRKHQYGTVFDHWQIRNTLGEGSGGKSAVFQLVHTSSPGVKSALKVISLIEERGDIDALSAARRADYETARKVCKDNAEQEVLLMNDFQGNTNIVDYLDHTFVDWSDDTGFGCDMLIRMELLTDLRSEIRSDKEYSEADVLKVGRDICQALILCHRKNILHRDIKPENIFKNKDGNYKLGDFGVSRIMSATPMSMASTSIGTPEYAAPEQFSGMHDLRIDIYSLGLVLYELCNGKKLPFATSSYITQQEVQMRQMGAPIPAPTQSSEKLSQVILKACSFNAAERYQTAQELFDDLDAAIKGKPLVVANKQPSYATMPAQPAAPSSYATMPAGAVNQNMGQKPIPRTMPIAEKNAPQHQSKSTPKKRSKGKLILFSILGGLLAIAIIASVLFLNWYNSPEQKILRALEADDYDTALSIYENEMDGKGSDAFVGALEKRIETAKGNFVNEGLSYESTMQELFTIEEMNVSDVERPLSEAKKEIDALNDSRVAFMTAESFFENKNYPEAMVHYRQVIEADGNYETAVKKLSNAEDFYRQEILDKAAEYAAEKLYTEAILELDTGLQHLPDDVDLITQKKVYEADYAEQLCAEALTKAEEYAQAGDYANAIKVIQNALENDSENAKLKAAYQKYSDAFVADEIAKADELIASNNYDEAITVLNKAIKVLPDSDVLAEKLADIRAHKPISLTTLKPINGSFSWNKGTPVDPFGNNYSNSTNYAIFEYSYGAYNTDPFVYYEEYRVYGKYTHLRGSLVPYESIYETGTAFFKIYADNELVYTSPMVTRKTDIFPFAVDISGAEYIKIEVTVNGRTSLSSRTYDAGAIILVDFMLSPE